MVLEVTLIDVLPGRENDFVNAYELARPVVAGTPGCRSLRLQRGLETPTRFVLLTEWDSVEAHEQNFRRTDRFAQWRALIGGSLAQPPLAEYFTDVTTGHRHNPDQDFFTSGQHP
ncbi:antibiotic biosynthesis monooxygenase family protein [Actinoplanes utahensis]|uniref:Antibiotic biosynthesis monooxygenase n=1 Tax=Actinoplanes utahensis TaxID=1869 RepID=A0A0A6XG39_ACTUT|nr:antibiotic biosynthesis monooxygenase family protein [Actinoplanes utahensis]KHD79077.1 antibiotic biosynthesis monooxygenase [Actinoplanes utahensis]GIF34100.1 antibiotic biosynthesis monooxygenase [Actinoplanes utahensis]